MNVPRRYGEGDHAQHGGGAGTDSSSAPPPAFAFGYGWSPSPFWGGILPATLLLITACATAPQPLTEAELAIYPDARGMPTEVQDFIVRHQDCVHWQGEPDFDAERRRQIQRAVADVCHGLDAEAQRLRARYSENAAVIERLRDYEPVGQ